MAARVLRGFIYFVDRSSGSPLVVPESVVVDRSIYHAGMGALAKSFSLVDRWGNSSGCVGRVRRCATTHASLRPGARPAFRARRRGRGSYFLLVPSRLTSRDLLPINGHRSVRTALVARRSR